MRHFANRKRLLGISLAVFALFSLLIVQFYKIQIIEGEKWKKLADNQHFFIVKEPFTRGTFFANTSINKAHPEEPQKFAFDIEKYHLYIDPDSLPERKREEIAGKLLFMLKIPSLDEAHFREQFDKKSRSRKLAMWLTTDMKAAINEWWQPYAKEHKIPRNALYFVTDYQRSYPFGKLLGQVLHTLQWQKDEKTGQAYPTGGLELYFDKYLRGKQGKRRLMRSPRNALETGDVICYPENGADVYLTINHILQAIVEEELEKGVKRFKAKAGWAVMMDPHSGEIWALAQFPFFYPPDYQRYFNDPKLIEDTKVKTITNAYEPGSVVKPITAAIALMANEELVGKGEKPLFDPEEMMPTANGKFPGRSKPITDTRLHYYLNMDLAIAKSSNIYMSRLVERIIERLGAKWYRSKLQETFGFGTKTGIELPSESAGFLPKIGKTYRSGVLEWSTSTPFSLAFGHNLLCNSLQLLRAWALFANGGYLVNPTLVKKIVRKNSETVEILYEKPPVNKEALPQPVPRNIINRVVQGIKYITKPVGSGAKGNIWGYSEAGKSSTAKKIVDGLYSESCYLGGFVGFSPVNDPAFILIVTLDEPVYGYIPGLGKNHNGGTCGAILFKEIGKRALEYLGIPPDDPHGYPRGDPRFDADKADWIKESQRLLEIYEKWNNRAKKKE